VFSRDALLVECVDAVDLVLTIADPQAGTTSEGIYAHIATLRIRILQKEKVPPRKVMRGRCFVGGRTTCPLRPHEALAREADEWMMAVS
jgi:hypothetical protein